MDLSVFDTFILAFAAMVAGILLLVRGGNWTIDSAIYIAQKFGISPLVVGFTIVAFGTSLPELVVSVFANLDGSGGIALGNVMGSNIANILMVLGIAAFFGPLFMSGSLKPIARDAVMLLVSVVILIGLLLFSGDIGRIAGFVMVLFLGAYSWMQYQLAQKGEAQNPLDAEDEPAFENDKLPYIFLLLGLICITIGAEFLVRGAGVSADILGVPEAVVALSIVAFGTSLPELSTCIIAVRKGHAELCFGNIIGSNVFNVLMILGVTALVKPIAAGSYALQLVDFDMWVVLGVSVLFSFALLVFRGVPKMLGCLFFAGYLVYNIYIYMMSMGV